MTIRFSKPFVQQYHKLPQSLRKKIDRQLGFLAQDIRHPSLYARRMVGYEKIWEARVDYHYRLTFEIVSNEIVVRKVGTHKIYQKP